MSSDYIPRLRSELLRAGAAKQARWRRPRPARRLRPIAAAAVVALLALAVVLTLSRGGNDETSVEQPAGALHLTYGVEPASATAAERTAQVMSARLAAAGIDDAAVSVPSAASLAITAPAGARADVTALVGTGRLAIYDWERSVLGSPATAVTKGEAEARAASRPDGRVVRALGNEPDRWFALGGDPAITDAEIAGARSTVDETTREPIVTIQFTDRGQTAFSALTRDLAHRGSAAAGDAGDDLDAYQHFAIVLDDRILATPYISFREAPDGIDGAAGTQIQGGMTPQTARDIAAILSTGPLPAALSNPTG